MLGETFSHVKTSKVRFENRTDMRESEATPHAVTASATQTACSDENGSEFPHCYLDPRTTHVKYMNDIYRTEGEWFRPVQELRPRSSWTKIADVINANDPCSGRWTTARLQRAARAYVAYGLLSHAIFDQPKARGIDDRLPKLVLSMRRENPGITLAEIGRTLGDMGEATPRGRSAWHPASVMTLLARADRLNRSSPK